MRVVGNLLSWVAPGLLEPPVLERGGAMMRERMSPKLRPDANHRAVRRVTLNAEGEGRVIGDRLMPRRAMSNPVSNVLRHARTGGRVTVVIHGDDAGTVVSIGNTGPVIAAEGLPHLFDRFCRADKARTHTSSEGAGLVLAITKAIDSAHKGRISVTSGARGTRFDFVFPRWIPNDFGRLAQVGNQAAPPRRPAQVSLNPLARQFGPDARYKAWEAVIA